MADCVVIGWQKIYPTAQHEAERAIKQHFSVVSASVPALTTLLMGCDLEVSAKETLSSSKMLFW